MAGRYLLAVSALVVAAPAASQVIFARGHWAAMTFSGRCEARARPLRANTAAGNAYAGFAFEPGGRRWGQFYAKLRRPVRPGSSVIVTIGNQPFLIAAGGALGLSRDRQQQRAMIEAARYATMMRIEARDASGRRSVERYWLDGAATAIDAAAAACAGKMR
ncbi:hypothetical protein G7078_01760 [Sphingomonas sinipercae]|uniref:Uncharacterized protein n=1 Tax=Sphingomonas sinipercae TaxID=2714944 RepID=A0A6G7ZL50_9SPHN|nr:hypothetical protein [Sphingomonas sinipercae]QIL01640.1 hypothetical protein G7078_01760 [Sphingomonas sinipercae]